jgi:hypothetical protein
MIAADIGEIIIKKPKTKTIGINCCCSKQLQCKGPVLDYGYDDFMLKPICAESLTNKPVIIPNVNTSPFFI